MSVQKVVCTVQIKLDLARLYCWVVDIAITEFSKLFDVIA